MDSGLYDFKVLLEQVEKNPDFESRITKKDSKFIDLTWDIFLNLYEHLRTEEKNEETENYVETSGEELKSLVESQAIDDEGIWRLLELLNCRQNYISTIAISSVKKNGLQLPLKVEKNCSDERNSNDSLNGGEEEEKEEEEEESDEDKEDDVYSEKESDKDKNDLSSHSIEKPDFFDEKSMLKFLDQSERTDKNNHDSDVDYFEDLLSENDSEAGDIKYDDFFDEDEEKSRNDSRRKNSDISESEIDEDENEEGEFEGSGADESMESGEEMDENTMMNENSSKISKSSYELKQERLKNKISKLENEALMEKPWPLKGEVEATQRPVNSLLEEIVEIDLSQRPAPVITKEVTMKLDDIIIKRIKDSAYDDVEKKLKPIEGPHEFKKAIVLDQEKSKLSLAEVYEKEYLKQKSETTAEKDHVEKMTPEQEEIKKMMHSVFKKLDTLSNFHFVPRPAVPEIKIVSNLPAVMMEEVAPVITSHGNLLAPEEISGESKKQLIGKDERSSTDKKRERRKKKKLQALRAKQSQKIPNTSVSYLTKSRNIKVLNQADSAPVKTSRQFFTKFQEEMDTNKSVKKRKHDKSVTNLNAKKFKL